LLGDVKPAQRGVASGTHVGRVSVEELVPSCPTYRRSVVLRFLSFLLSPRRMLQRDWQQRRRELNAAFARGRKIRRERIGT
jgi:hypothetical protein